MTNEMQAQLTAAQLHDELNEAEATIKAIADKLPLAEREGGLAFTLAKLAADHLEGRA